MARTKLIGEQREGSVGDVTYYQRNGQTIVRVKHGRTSKTLNAMKHKAKWANVLNSWKVFSRNKILKDNFLRGPGKTEYNIYMSLNIRVAQMYLTKELAHEGRVILDNFVISYGPLLPAVEVRQEGGLHVSNLEVGPLEVDDNTLVSNLISALANHNDGFLHNASDEILFYAIRQTSRSISGIRIALNNSMSLDTRTLSQAFGPGRFRSRDGHLATPILEDELVAWVRRTQEAGGRIVASTQQLVGEPPKGYIYASDFALEKALESYAPIDINYMAPGENVEAWKNQDPLVSVES